MQTISCQSRKVVQDMTWQMGSAFASVATEKRRQQSKISAARGQNGSQPTGRRRRRGGRRAVRITPTLPNKNPGRLLCVCGRKFPRGF